MKKSSISTKIRVLGILFTLLMVSIVTTTIYLNNNNSQDAMIINIAGKQRMLTQNISKNIFYLYSNKTANQNELNESIDEFIYNLSTLKGENHLDKLKNSPNSKIDKQMIKVEYLWSNFLKDINFFKELLLDETKKDELIIIAKALFICFCSIVLLKIFGC